MLHYIFKKHFKKHFKKYTIVLPHRRISCPLNSEDKGDVTKLKICEIMGYLRISRKTQDEKRPLVKIQPVSANWQGGIWAPVNSDDSKQILLK